MTSLIIPDALDKRLNSFAKKANTSKDKYALHIIEEFLEDREDYLIADACLKQIEKGDHKTFSYEETLKELDLDKKESH